MFQYPMGNGTENNMIGFGEFGKVSIPYGKWNLAAGIIFLVILVVSIPYGKWNPVFSEHGLICHMKFQYPMGNGTNGGKK